MKQIVIYAVLTVVVLIPMKSVYAQSSGETVAAITKLENEGIKADLSGDASWAQKFLAVDWMACDHEGKWYNKADALKIIADTKNNKFNSEKLTDLVIPLSQHTRTLMMHWSGGNPRRSQTKSPMFG